MKKFLFWVVVGCLLVPAVVQALPEDVFTPFYWISLSVSNPSGVPLAGKKVYLYQTQEDKDAGRYVAADLSVGNILLNGFELGLDNFRVGQTYFVDTDSIEVSGRIYGARSQVTISGLGWDEPVSPLVIASGYNPSAETVEIAPKIKVWYGYRLYQSQLVSDTNRFIVTNNPSIRLDVSIEPPYTLSTDAGNYSASVHNTSTNQTRRLDIQTANISAQSGGSEGIRSLDINLNPELTNGVNTLSFTARSSGALGIASAETVVTTVEVMGGPGELVGQPLTYPSPFSITRDRNVTIQYTLTRDLAIQIIFVDISGQRVKNLIIEAGQEGGAAGLNKITWDGRTDRGSLAGNGIYVGTIIARDEGRRLGSVKLTVVN